jgi:hypothetical protein
VLEYCAESELHPRSGLGMLQGRQILGADLGKIHVSAAFAISPALEKPTQTCNLKTQKCYLCSEPKVLPMF